MKIHSACFKCCSKTPLSPIKMEGFLSIKEENIYHFKCINGHDNLFEISAFKFELLYESGLCAIRDYYYLESVISLSASLERFNEFFVKILMLSKGYTIDQFDNVFKNIANQTERQIGAFIFMYAAFFNDSAPLLLKSKSVEFRNKVVHKGYLPNEEEIMKYAEDIFNVIRSNYLKLNSVYRQIIRDYSGQTQSTNRKKYNDMARNFNTSIAVFCPISGLTDFSKERNFKEYFEKVKNSPFYQ
jgi:hypothetical protein